LAWAATSRAWRVALAWVELQLAHLGHHGVDIDQVLDPPGQAIGDGRAQHAGVGVHGQHHVLQLFGLDGLQQVADVGLERDRGDIRWRARPARSA
jgi:hypothetical protein